MSPSVAVAASAASPLAVASRLAELEDLVRRRQLARLGQRLAGLDEQHRAQRIALGSIHTGSTKEVRGRGHVPTGVGSPAGGGQAIGCSDTQLHAMRIKRSKLGQVPVCLLQVVAQDLLELEAAIRPRVALVGPVHEPLVQAGACSLQQAVVGGVPDEDVVEPVARVVVQHRGLVDQLTAVERREMSRAGLVAVGRASTSGPPTPSNSRPMTDAGSMTARSPCAEAVQPGREQRVDGGRDGDLPDVVGESPVALDLPDGALVDEHRDELFHEQRIALGRGRHALSDGRSEPGLARAAPPRSGPPGHRRGDPARCAPAADPLPTRRASRAARVGPCT